MSEQARQQGGEYRHPGQVAREVLGSNDESGSEVKSIWVPDEQWEAKHNRRYGSRNSRNPKGRERFDALFKN